ncbi:MAG TPA: GntR family transcriptional regulator [Candidatus Cloacimonadota bacterium]|nr:GntR family transcriptional regulator [Candidatus Cloacimonadota bacterium]HPT72034.1 GntR family transcriptional regulator [Candidatus Cloacimonadota bacterium]
MKKFNDTSPIYLQMRSEVEDAILSGVLKEEEMVQSIRTLAQQYAINPLTVAKALSELVDEGILIKQRGVGFYVAPNAVSELRRKKVTEFLDHEIKVFVMKAKQLGISLNDFVKMIKAAYTEEAHDSNHGN